MPVQIPADADLNTLRTPGFYWCDGSTNANRPDDSGSFCLLIEKTGSWAGNGVKQTFTNYDSGAIYTRVSPKDIWKPWRLLATATPPQEFSLPLSAGWETQSGGDAKYFKTQEDIVHVSMNVKSNAAVAAGDTIATLPAGFRPASQLKIPIICKVSGQGALKFGHFDVGHDGGIRIYDAVTGSEIVTEIAVAPFAFDAAG